MNNKKLYNNIISDISKIMKKKLYENNEIDINQYVEYQPKYNFKYLDLKKLPEKLIYELCDKIIDSDYQIDYNIDTDPKNTYGQFHIIYETKNDPILKLLDSNEITIVFKADFIFDYKEGQKGDYWTEPIPDYYYIKDAEIYDVYLTDSKDNYVQITDNNYMNILSDLLLNDNDIIETWEYEHMDDYSSAKEYYNDLYGND